MVPRSDVTAPVRRRARVARRRRRNLARLLAAVFVSLGLSFIPGMRWMLFVFLALDLGLGLYVWQLRRWKVGEQRRIVDVESALLTEPSVEELARKTG